MKMNKLLVSVLFLSVMLSACVFPGATSGSYRQISAEEANDLMNQEQDYIILDVRTPEEFAREHIPNAINIPNESIGDSKIPELPKKDQLILVYCRSGNRSKEAAEKLVALRYKNVVEFGGIKDWEWETVSEEIAGHTHRYTEKIHDSEYFAADATEERATTYFYSCECGEASQDRTFEHGKNTNELLPVGSNVKNTLDGKKILFVGCSYNHYGKIVNFLDTTVTNQSARVNDTGYFYELCKQNGANVSVTNWCFGGHDLSDLLGTSCAADRQCGNGHDHLSDLVERDYDYVSLMDITRPALLTEEEYLEELKSYMKIFTDVNPNCKFIYSIPIGTYFYNEFRNPYGIEAQFAAKVAKLDNVIVMDWGRILLDLINGDTVIPDSDTVCDLKTFIVSDKVHPNLLSGYINTLMTYCLITGETAIGQPIDLENGTETALRFRKDRYMNYYVGKTNFLEIMESESDMRGIQQIINRYIDMETYRYYE